MIPYFAEVIADLFGVGLGFASCQGFESKIGQLKKLLMELTNWHCEDKDKWMQVMTYEFLYQFFLPPLIDLPPQKTFTPMLAREPLWSEGHCRICCVVADQGANLCKWCSDSSHLWNSLDAGFLTAAAKDYYKDKEEAVSNTLNNRSTSNPPQAPQEEESETDESDDDHFDNIEPLVEEEDVD